MLPGLCRRSPRRSLCTVFLGGRAELAHAADKPSPTRKIAARRSQNAPSSSRSIEPGETRNDGVFVGDWLAQQLDGADCE